MDGAHRTRARIQLPRRQRHYGFALTPLADAMFQLLVFFMLSANLTPYSLLNLRAGAIAGGRAAEPSDSGDPTGPQAMAPGETAIWSVSRESIVASGQRFGFDALPQLAQAIRGAGTARVLLVTRPDAQVQGIVSVLEALAAHDITDVQLASTSAGADR
ncbi:biopolymer transporter ExbD [Paracoccus sp. M683]|uniref:ExbD/TolR family protein n=1 Tax=Paracoccus sp. M683 TaxID=2594268 RepID=UPI00117EDA83|nr:biopolymer transporter ExbD [Paracoccus sp. M683]TRW99581.1 biopolymer transporter ExbD [Paracoccus sp. M683]